MINSRIVGLSLVLMLTGSIGASPADAQGKSKANKNKSKVEKVEKRLQQRPVLERRTTLEEVIWPGDRVDSRDGRARKGVPPGWCIGKGNPHNTPENCRYSNGGIWGDLDGRSDSRYPYPDGRIGDSRYPYPDSRAGMDRGSYDAAHREFHRIHDRRCQELASRSPLDPIYQLEVRGQCKLEHDEWHRRAGIAH